MKSGQAQNYDEFPSSLQTGESKIKWNQTSDIILDQDDQTTKDDEQAKVIQTVEQAIIFESAMESQIRDENHDTEPIQMCTPTLKVGTLVTSLDQVKP